ncbi:MAG TPA: terminase [Rugosimonospora sp.]|nr:terminase [Rugosimonospora sp.]
MVLDGWDADGEPVGRPWSSLGFKAKAQIVAVSEDQTANTWDPLLEMAREGPVSDAYDIEPMETFVNVPRGRIEYTTSSALSREGFRPVFAALDQTESWVNSNGGLKLAASIRRNLSKVGGSSVETPNAWVPGLNSVAEKSHEAWLQQQEGRLKGEDGILLDHREAPPDTDPADRGSLMAGLAAAYGDSADVNGGHVTLARILEDYWDPATEPGEARRFFLNQIAPAEDAWLAPQEWAAIADSAHVVPDAAEIVLFFDGSKSNDATALIGCEIETGHVFEIGVWEPDPADPDSQVPVHEVNAAVARAFDRWRPVAFFADVREWESFVHTAWPEAYGDRLLVMANPRGRNAGPIAWDMRARTQEFTLAAEACHSDIIERQFTHDGSSPVARHVANARRRPNRYGVSVGKESPRSPLKIDAAVCVIGARMVRRIVLGSPEWAKRTAKKTRTGRVYGFS